MAQILLAEPDRPIRDFIAGILMDFGHDVTACQNCTEAVALLADGHGNQPQTREKPFIFGGFGIGRGEQFLTVKDRIGPRQEAGIS